MKLATVALAAAIALSSTAALAQAAGNCGIRNGDGAIGGDVQLAVGGHDKCSPHLAEHYNLRAFT